MIVVMGKLSVSFRLCLDQLLFGCFNPNTGNNVASLKEDLTELISREIMHITFSVYFHFLLMTVWRI